MVLAQAINGLPSGDQSKQSPNGVVFAAIALPQHSTIWGSMSSMKSRNILLTC